MKVVSFNINSLRARPHQLESVIALHQPDVIALQETKVNDPDFPLDMIEKTGYYPSFHGQKGHYGVATLSKQKPLTEIKGFPSDEDDAQRRVLITEHAFAGESFWLFNGYFPQGESRDHPVKFPAKEKFYRDLDAFLSPEQMKKQWLVVGDFNISHRDQDIGIGEKNAKRWLRTGKCSFLPEEREWLDAIMAKGFVDTYRMHHPEVTDRFSWFDYRSKGFDDDPKRGLRIDLILASDNMAKRCINADIDYQTRSMEKPSDHCPIWAEFKE